MMLKNKGNLPCFLPKIKYNADCTEKLLKEDRFIYFIIPQYVNIWNSVCTSSSRP